MAAAAAAPAPAIAAAAVAPGGANNAVQAAPLDMAMFFAQMMQQQALQNAAQLAQSEATRLGAESAAADALAQQRRVGAGPAPLFHGKLQDIAVHTWLITLERWFESAHIDAAGADAERLEVAAGALRDAAATWFAAMRADDVTLVASGAASKLSTWADFTAAVRKHFLPQATELWALQELETLAGSNARDVARYTNQFVELNMLVPPQSSGEQLSRVLTYRRGLPEAYRVKAAEKQHATLSAAMESTLALWNAKTAAHAQSSRPPAKVSNTQAAEESDGAWQSAASAPAEDRVSRLEQRMDAFLSAMQSSGGGFNRGGRGGGYGGPQGRGRDRQPQREGARPPRARTPGVSEAQAKERLAARVCIKCARPDHFARECTNEARKEDGLPTN